MRRSMAFLMSLLLAALAGQGAHAAQSVYTDLVLDDCETLVAPQPNEPGGDFISALCPGFGEYKVLFKEGDLRQSIHYGYLDKSIIDDAFVSFAQFNHANPRIEWRIGAGGKPVAAIQRFFVGEQGSEGQILVISKVGQPGEGQGCPVGYVDALANKDPNLIARAVADTRARHFRCGESKPDYHGARGDKGGIPMINQGGKQQTVE